jgi:hypothetical protein
MEKFTDAQMAEFVLEARRDGVEVAQRRASRKRWSQWGAFFLLIGGMMAIGSVFAAPLFTAFAAGIGIGALWSYYTTLKRANHVWSFYLKVIDWSKVEEIATNTGVVHSRGEGP